MPADPFHKIIFLAPVSLCIFASCKDNEIRTYKIASDSQSENSPPPNTAPVTTNLTPQPIAPSSGAVIWQAPKDWKEEAASKFLTASYSLPGGGRVTVSKLNGDGGGLTANINRWLGQIGLKPISENEMVGQPFKVIESDKEMLLYNLTAPESADDAQGILAGVLPLEAETWYFKFTGTVAVIKKSEAIFGEFLRSIRIPSSQKSAATPTPTDRSKINVTPPEGWTPSEGSSMRAASFSIAGPDGTSADVSVIPLPGDAGSILDNVNRWRGQLQLAPLQSADDPALGKTEKTPAGDVLISHMTSIEPVADGKPAAIGAAILHRPGMTWFFKITGEASIVQANIEKFDNFVRSATFP